MKVVKLPRPKKAGVEAKAANLVRGEIPFTAIGRNWVAVSGFLANLQIEQMFDEPPQMVIDRVFVRVPARIANDQEALHALMSRIRISDIIGVLRALLILHQPEIDNVTVAQIVDDIGYEATIELMQRALNAAAAKPKPGAVPNPPKARTPTAKRAGRKS